MRGLYAIIYSERKQRAVEAAEKILEILERNGVKSLSMNAREAVEKGLPPNIEALIALGGDGTILKAVSVLPGKDVPVLGINYGRGGYLMELDPLRLEEAVEAVIRGRYRTVEVLRLSVRMNGKHIGDALNEAYISSIQPGKILKFTIIQENELLSFPSDALIVSTPIGSTAYAYSAGGPLVDERLAAAVLVPVCPLIDVRPVVLSISEPILIKVEGGENIQLLIDGFVKEVSSANKVEILVEKAEKTVRFIRLGFGEGFAKRIRKRIGGEKG